MHRVNLSISINDDDFASAVGITARIADLITEHHPTASVIDAGISGPPLAAEIDAADEKVNELEIKKTAEKTKKKTAAKKTAAKKTAAKKTAAKKAPPKEVEAEVDEDDDEPEAKDVEVDDEPEAKDVEVDDEPVRDGPSEDEVRQAIRNWASDNKPNGAKRVREATGGRQLADLTQDELDEVCETLGVQL